MDETKEFLVLRYSLIEEQQKTTFTEPIPSPKGKTILVAIDQDREFILNGVVYSFVGFSEVSPPLGSNFPPSRFFIGKTAKLKKAHMGKKVPGDIIETREDDWVPVITIFDIETQHIFVRKDWNFGTPEQTMRAIQGGLREPILAQYNHRIFVEGKTRVEHFWKVISEHKHIYKLELKLISPNILDTNMQAREALEALKKLFGQDEVSIELDSEAGQLKVPNTPVGNYLEYIEEGEGSWSVTTEGVTGGGKKKHTSLEHTETVELPVPTESEQYESAQKEFGEVEGFPQNHSADAKMIAAIYAVIGQSHDS